MRTPSLLVLVLAAALAGCRTPPPEDSPASGASALARPVPTLRTTAPADEPILPESMDLDEVLDLALRRNETVLRSSLGVAVAEAGVDESFSNMFLPRIVASVRGTVLSPQPSFSTPIGSLPAVDDDELRWRVAIRVPVFHTANALYLYDAAALGPDMARLAARRSEQQVRYVVTQAFFLRLSLERRREVIREFIRSLGAQADDTQARVDAGAAIENDVLKIQLELTRQKQALVEIDNTIEMAAMRLNTLLALPRDTAYGLRWEREFAERSLAPTEALVRQAQDVRPDLRVQDLLLRQLDLRRRGEWARFAPTVDAFASFDYSDTEVFDSNHTGTLGFEITWELFDGGGRNHRAARLSHEARQVEAGLREARRQVALEVEASIRDQENRASAVALGRSAVAQATENLRVQRALYRNNRSTANDLIEAEVQLTQARETVIQATYAYEIAFGRLAAAVGAEDALTAPE